MTPEIVNKYNVATTLLNKKKYDKAIKLFKEVLKEYEFREAYLNLGNCYKFTDKDTLSMQCYKKANTPGMPYTDSKADATKDYNLALNNIGLMNFTYGRDYEAILNYDRAIANDPNFHDARWNKATATLRLACSGDPELFMLGWQLYEARFQKTPPVELKSDRKLELWRGESNCNVIVLAEQGIGDNIMFYRYLEPLEKRFNVTFIFQCDATLGSIISPLGRRTCFLTSTEDAKFGIPVGSLAMIYDSLEIPNAPYLPRPTPFLIDNTRPNIGFVYSGSPTHANDRNRSVAAQRFKRFAKYGNMWHLNPAAPCPSWAKQCKISSWEDTCKWLAALDFIITIDTSIVHMAGAMGVRGLMLQPLKETDFRWGTEAYGSKNMWYPSISIVRNPNDWDFTFDSAEETVKEWI